MGATKACMALRPQCDPCGIHWKRVCMQMWCVFANVRRAHGAGGRTRRPRWTWWTTSSAPCCPPRSRTTCRRARASSGSRHNVLGSDTLLFYSSFCKSTPALLWCCPWRRLSSSTSFSFLFGSLLRFVMRVCFLPPGKGPGPAAAQRPRTQAAGRQHGRHQHVLHRLLRLCLQRTPL